jgi:hypothetical protein
MQRQGEGTLLWCGLLLNNVAELGDPIAEHFLMSYCSKADHISQNGESWRASGCLHDTFLSVPNWEDHNHDDDDDDDDDYYYY